MALPVVIDSSLRWSWTLNQRHGPFEVGSNIYIVAHNETSGTIEVWKSTDGGNTWAEQDSANAPLYNTLIASHDAVIRSGTIYVSWLTTGPSLRVTPFDTSTDTWQTVTSGTSAPAPTANVSTANAFFLSVRSTGELVVFHNGPTERLMGVDYRRATYSRYTGGAWAATNFNVGQTGTQVSSDARAIAVDLNDRCYFFYTDSNSSALLCKTFNSANTVGSATNVDIGAVGGTTNWPIGHPIVVDDVTDYVLVPYADSGGVGAVAKANVADTPSWTLQSVTTTNGFEYTNAPPAAITMAGTTAHIFFIRDVDQTIYRDANVAGAGYGTDTAFATGISASGINIGTLTTAANGVAVLYYSGAGATGSVTFDIYSLGGITELGAAAFSGSGTATQVATKTTVAASAVSASGTLTSGSYNEVQGASTLDAAGTLASDSIIEVWATSTLDATGTLTSDSYNEVQGASVLDATGTLASDSYNEVQGASALDATGTQTADATVTTGGVIELGAADFTASGTLASDSYNEVQGALAVDASGTQAAAAILDIVGAVTLDASGTQVADSTADVPSAAAFDATGTQTADGTIATGGAITRPDAVQTVVNTTATGSITYNKPTTLNNGDVIVVGFAKNGGSNSITLPDASWVTILGGGAQSNPKVFAYYKVITDAANEPSTYTFTFATSVANSGGLIRLVGVDTTTPLDVAASTADGTAGPYTIPGVTTVTNGAYLFALLALNSSNVANTISLTGFTELWDLGGKRNDAEELIQTTAGATGDQTFTVSTSSLAWAGVLAAFRPAAGGGVIRSGAADLSGSGTQTVDSVSDVPASFAGDATGTSSVAAVRDFTAIVDVSASGTATADSVADVVADASLDANGTLLAGAQGDVPASSSLSATSTQTIDSTVEHTGASDLSSTSAQIVDTAVEHVAQSALDATSNATATGEVNILYVTGDSALDAASALTSDALIEVWGDATLDATSSSTFGPSLDVGGASTLSATASLVSDSLNTVEGAAGFSATSDQTAFAGLTVVFASTLDAQSLQTVNGARIFSDASALDAASNATVAGQIVVQGAAAFTAATDQTVASVFNYGGQATLDATSNLVAAFVLDLQGVAGLTAQGTVLASGTTAFVHARPSSDVLTGGWTTLPLYANIDEVVADTADYIESSSAPINDACEVALSTITSNASLAQEVSYQYGKNGPDIVNLTVELRQGTTIIASWTHNDISATPTIAQQALTAGQKASITDYADLRLRFIANPS